MADQPRSLAMGMTATDMLTCTQQSVAGGARGEAGAVCCLHTPTESQIHCCCFRQASTAANRRHRLHQTCMHPASRDQGPGSLAAVTQLLLLREETHLVHVAEHKRHCHHEHDPPAVGQAPLLHLWGRSCCWWAALSCMARHHCPVSTRLGAIAGRAAVCWAGCGVLDTH